MMVGIGLAGDVANAEGGSSTITETRSEVRGSLLAETASTLVDPGPGSGKAGTIVMPLGVERTSCEIDQTLCMRIAPGDNVTATVVGPTEGDFLINFKAVDRVLEKQARLRLVISVDGSTSVINQSLTGDAMSVQLPPLTRGRHDVTITLSYAHEMKGMDVSFPGLTESVATRPALLRESTPVEDPTRPAVSDEFDCSAHWNDGDLELRGALPLSGLEVVEATLVDGSDPERARIVLRSTRKGDNGIGNEGTDPLTYEVKVPRPGRLAGVPVLDYQDTSSGMAHCRLVRVDTPAGSRGYRGAPSFQAEIAMTQTDDGIRTSYVDSAGAGIGEDVNCSTHTVSGRFPRRTTMSCVGVRTGSLFETVLSNDPADLSTPVCVVELNQAMESGSPAKIREARTKCGKDLHTFTVTFRRVNRVR